MEPSHKASADSGQLLDDLLNRFDETWQQHWAPSIEEFLPAQDEAHYDALLVEMIMIDLEYRWRGAKAQAAQERDPETLSNSPSQGDSLPWFPMLRDYQRRFSSLVTNPKSSRRWIIPTS